MNNLNKKTAVQSAQLRQLFSASKVSLVTSTLLASILAYAQREMIASTVVIIWFSLILLVAFSRTVLVNAYQASSLDNEATTHFWLTRFRIGVLAVGVVWGSAGFLMFPINSPQHQMLLIFMLAGLSAGGVVAFSADLISAVLFSTTSLVPIIFRLFITGDRLFVTMGMAGILYLSFMIVSLVRINRSITENIVLRLDAVEREETMKISEQRYRLLLKHSPIGIFHYDTELVITYCNEPFADILQSTVHDILGLDIKTLMDQSILKVLKNALKGERILYEGQYCVNLNAPVIWIDMTCAPSRDGTGRIVGGIAIIRDITDRKMADEMLRISAIAFESQSAMIVTTPNSVILRVNRAFTTRTGYTVLRKLLGRLHTYSVLDAMTRDSLMPCGVL
jgi:PAS domain S-box-containing protein